MARRVRVPTPACGSRRIFDNLITHTADLLCPLQERSQEATAIARDAVELRDMMRDMSGMVTEQGESVQIIEDHVDETRAHVVQANRELVQAAEYQASYRRKMCCIIGAVTLGVLAAIVIPLVIHFFPQGGGPPPFRMV